LKDLLVCIDESEPARARLDFAVALARIHAARLTGLFALDLVPTIAGLIRGYGGQHEFLANSAALRERARDAAARLEAEFTDRLRREDLAGEWRFVESLPAETAALHARYADLAIVGQIDPEKPNPVNAARLPRRCCSPRVARRSSCPMPAALPAIASGSWLAGPRRARPRAPSTTRCPCSSGQRRLPC